MTQDGTAVASADGLSVVLGYPGANAAEVAVDGATVELAPDLRDAGDEWLFYWNAGVESDAARSVTLSFPDEVVGPWGPAVSADRRTWTWLGADATRDRTAFRYAFDAGERAFFAFSLPYALADFERFWAGVEERAGVERATLATTAGGRSSPVVRIGDPSADVHAVFACRHHACESTASHAFEGTLAELAASPPTDWCVHAVPFVDLDGVQRGDQGKRRLPHDHNRDYAEANGVAEDIDPLYRTTEALQRYVRDLSGDLALALDFHSPFKWGVPHDRVFFACDPGATTARDRRLARALHRETSRDGAALQYDASDGFARPGGRSGGATFAAFADRAGATVSRTLEVPYFGTEYNRVTADRCRGLGRAVARSARRFVDVD